MRGTLSWDEKCFRGLSLASIDLNSREKDTGKKEGKNLGKEEKEEER